jgi:ATPase subunit of ABC transporter with duplicated ATPase domains
MKTEWLQLELDAGAFSGCSGRFLLRIPGKMIDWGEGAPPPKKSAADIKREEDQARAAAKLRAEAKLQRERAEREEMERAAAAQAKRAAQQAKEEKEAEEARILEAKAKADALKMAKAEASSTEWLRAIRKMIEQDKIETAIKRLKYVLEEFPGTTGAAEAAKLLKELDK